MAEIGGTEMVKDEKKILVVDDDQLSLFVVGEYLDGTDYKYDFAENGDQAWNMLLEAPDKYSVIVLDRMMPRIDGIEILTRIKKEPTMAHIPVILQTAKATKEDYQEGTDAGAFYYLTKPFDKHLFLKVLNDALSQLD